MAETPTLNTADIMAPVVPFPEYHEPFELFGPTLEFPQYHEPLDIMTTISGATTPRGGPVNKLVEQVLRTPGRQPSPQPTHFSVPQKNGNGNGHRVLRAATVGYIAPEFKGKKEQMVHG